MSSLTERLRLISLNIPVSSPISSRVTTGISTLKSPLLIRCTPASRRRIGRRNTCASSAASRQTTKMIPVVASTTVRVKVASRAKASVVLILLTIDQCRLVIVPIGA